MRTVPSKSALSPVSFDAVSGQPSIITDYSTAFAVVLLRSRRDSMCTCVSLFLFVVYFFIKNRFDATDLPANDARVVVSSNSDNGSW